MAGEITEYRRDLKKNKQTTKTTPMLRAPSFYGRRTSQLLLHCKKKKKKVSLVTSADDALGQMMTK